VIDVPPSFVGAVQYNMTFALQGVPINDIGASATAYVDVVAISLGGPVPTAFAART
jgi:hypothetical protein